MLVSIRHRLVILAMPKCGSTALERALAGRMDLVVSGHPAAKHTMFRKYHRLVRPYLESIAPGPYETMCLVREPVDWLRSWWCYRARAGTRPGRETRGMAFEDFARAYLEARAPAGDIGAQARFVAARDGGIGVDRLFRHEDRATYLAYLGERLGDPVVTVPCNVSPPPPGNPALSRDTAHRLRAVLAPDFAVHARAGGG